MMKKKHHIINKSLAAAVILFAAYAIFVNYFAPKWWKASQHQWQTNVIQAEKYIYNEKKDTIINMIVGSSLSVRLIMDSLPHTYNLSFGGYSIFDGLDILRHIEPTKLPQNLFIEMNIVFKEEDEAFKETLNSLLYYPKKEIVALRTDKQPLAIIGMRLSGFTQNILLRIRSLHNKLFTNTPQNSDPAIFPKLLADKIKSYNELVPDKQLSKSFVRLKNYVDYFERNKVHIIFFEMPLNEKLNKLPKANAIRQTFYKYFPAAQYNYISLPDSMNFVSTDGLHLGGAEALKYTMYFKKQMQNLLK